MLIRSTYLSLKLGPGVGGCPGRVILGQLHPGPVLAAGVGTRWVCGAGGMWGGGNGLLGRGLGGCRWGQFCLALVVVAGGLLVASLVR